MKTATVSDFRTHMKEHLSEVEKDQDILILSGPKNKNFVLITLDQFNSMEETAHLLSTRNNTERLMKGIAQHKAGKTAHTFGLQESQAPKPARAPVTTELKERRKRKKS
jgi:antitoxin YefM